MECKNNEVLHKEDCGKPRIKDEHLNPEELTTGSQASHVQQNGNFIKCVLSSDVDTKLGVKQEIWDPNVAFSDINFGPMKLSTFKDDDEIDIKEHDLQDVVSPESQSLQLQQNGTSFKEYGVNSDMDTKVGIKQEVLDPNDVSSDIKCTTKQPITLNLVPYLCTDTLAAGDEIHIKEELECCEETSADSVNEIKESDSKQNETAEDVALFESTRLNEESCKINEVKKQKCEISARTYSTRWKFKHKMVHVDKKPHNCDVCDSNFTQLGSLNRHKLIHAGKNPHKCFVCDRGFTLMGSLKLHKFIHEDKKPHKCDVCDEIFTVLANLKTHKLIHEGEKPYKCDVCNKSFSVRASLKTHKLIHAGRKPHKCDVCDRSFTKLGSLKVHKLIHEGKRKHKCDMCDKSFILQAGLKTQKLIHEGIKPHKCGICDRSFTELGNLKIYILIHTREKPYKCDVCHKGFSLRASLKKHKFIHEGRKPHKCDICDRSFTQMGNLKRHKLIHERERPY